MTEPAGCDLLFVVHRLTPPDRLVAVARSGPELGVDVEDTWRRSHTDQIAEHFFAPAEVAALRAWATRFARPA